MRFDEKSRGRVTASFTGARVRHQVEVRVGKAMHQISVREARIDRIRIVEGQHAPRLICTQAGQ